MINGLNDNSRYTIHIFDKANEKILNNQLVCTIDLQNAG